MYRLQTNPPQTDLFEALVRHAEKQEKREMDWNGEIQYVQWNERRTTWRGDRNIKKSVADDTVELNIGVIINSDLKFAKHIQSRKIGNTLLGFIARIPECNTLSAMLSLCSNACRQLYILWLRTQQHEDDSGCSILFFFFHLKQYLIHLFM